MKKISVIMACKNSGETIKKSLESFFRQNLHGKELVIIDGGSTDKTIDIINNYQNENIIFETIKNLGLYESINYGIKKATGSIIGLLHSDDVYYDDNVLNKVYENFALEKLDAIYTDVVFINKTEKIIRKWINTKVDATSAANGLLPPHTGLYLKKSVFEIVGYYNSNYKISSDIEFMYKLFLNKDIKKKHLKFFSVRMLIGGLSTKSPVNILKSNFEVYKILKDLQVMHPITIILKKILTKIKQYNK
jgi:glycosyltransferase involved in cell wall biosynthesis